MMNASANPNLAMFAQMAQGGGMPQGMMPQGAPPPVAGAAPPAMPPMGAPPMGQGQPPAAQAAPGAAGQRFTPQQLAALGRNGDQTIAHLTPGEIAVPPQVQTPKVLATINKAFQKKGISPAQFTAGSPQSSVNPQTGVPEYNFLSAFLPAALGIAGSAIVPGLGLAMSPMLAGALGGGAGTFLGGMLSGQTPMQAALAGLGSGAGGYMLGNLMSPAASAASAGAGAGSASMANEVAQQAVKSPFDVAMGPSGAAALSDPTANLANFTQAANLAPGAASAASSAASSVAAPTVSGGSSGLLNSFKNYFQNINPAQAAGSALGGMIGGAVGAPPPKDTGPKYPPGFNEHFPSMDQIKPWSELLGQNTYRGPVPNFTDYNASAPGSTGYNFYPQ